MSDPNASKGAMAPDAPLAGLYDACIHCGLCLTSCPTYRETGDEANSPRGRIYLVRALEEGRLQPGPDVNAPLDACVGCRACETACPAGMKYGAMLERARTRYVEPTRPRDVRTMVMRPLLRQVLPFKNRMALATLPGKLARRVLVREGKAPAWLPPALARPLELLPAPQPAAGALPEWTAAIGEEKGVVALLEGCAMPALYPAVNHATVRLLARAGYRVWAPRAAGCCGAIHLHDGDLEGARTRARANVAAFERHEVAAVISNAGGCGAALHEYGDLLADDPAWAARAAALAAKATDLARFLAKAGLPAPTRPREVVATWHDPCHAAHGLGVRAEPRALVRGMPGVRYVELAEADWCCGGAGSYTLLQPAMADKLLAHKVRHVVESGAEVLVTANPPCLMQIGRGLAQAGWPGRIVHLAEFLDGFYT